ncbi:hypothetical protein [Streptomyces sp. Inha503]|uniref:hypothetical protein n=1 Tax=Streptomyces sp. Inha503 TaxID=3383314 RepID=UPI0039A09CFA
MDQEQAARLTYEAIAHAVAGEADQAATNLITLGQGSDDNQMYGVCCAIAEAGAHMLRKIYGDRAPKTPDEGMWAIQPLKPGAVDENPPKAFAVRFLIAYANGDQQTTLALFNAALHSDGNQYVDSVCALLADVAGITRLAIDQRTT